MKIGHKISIKENAIIAKIAARKLNEESVAIVLGNTIYLFGVSRIDFLNNERWLRHEMEHIRQFRQYGFIPFLYKYLMESWRNGYHNNCFEIEARAAEIKKGI